MEQVNTEVMETTHTETYSESPRQRILGKKKLPPDRKRVILSVRVLPSTMDYLKQMGYGTTGRAIDVLVKAVQHKGIAKMIDAGSDVTIVNISG